MLGTGKLDLFARHHETNEPIPEDLFTKMIRAKNFMAGNAMMRQLAFSKLDLVLHRSLAKDPPEDIEESLQELLQEYFPKRKTRPHTIAMRSVIYSVILWVMRPPTTHTSGQRSWMPMHLPASGRKVS